MSPRLLLRTFVNERLTAAAEEIFQIFEGTILKYEEEASSSQQEIDRLRCLLLECAATSKKFPQSPVDNGETPRDQNDAEPEASLSSCQINSQLRHIKEEDPEHWEGQLQGGGGEEEEEEQVTKFKHVNFSYLPHSSTWREDEPKDIKPPPIPETQNGEREEQETETMQFRLPVTITLSSQALIQNERVQDRREEEEDDDRRVPGLTSDRTQTNQTSQSPFDAPGESARLTHFDPFAPDYRCRLCNRCFPSISHLVNHAFQTHAKAGEAACCAVCGQSSESAQSLAAHLKSHKASRYCHVCGKRCNNPSALGEHMSSHTGVKLHRCHVCGKECSRKGDLKIHMRIHTGEKPFRCSCCPKSFTHSGHLRKHMRSHTGERPHRCHVCGRGFLQSTHLKYHLGTHAQKL